MSRILILILALGGLTACTAGVGGTSASAPIDPVDNLAEPTDGLENELETE